MHVHAKTSTQSGQLCFRGDEDVFACPKHFEWKCCVVGNLGESFLLENNNKKQQKSTQTEFNNEKNAETSISRYINNT